LLPSAFPESAFKEAAMACEKTQSKFVPARSPQTITCSLAGPVLVFSLLAAAAVALGVTRNSAAQEEGGSAETRNCVDLMRIDRTEVVDDNTVLFYMRNGTVFRNELQNACPTLGFEERFMYRTALTQLCDIDVITVLQDVGFGFMPTASCGLGKFQPIDEQAAEDLIARAEQRAGNR
jgi:hypothetical protein